MKVVISPQAFKGGLSGIEAAQAISLGLMRVFPHARTTLLPVADGGDGTMEALVQSTRGRYLDTQVTGPLGDSINVKWGVAGDSDTALIEMARASGLALIPAGRRDPTTATSYGTGELIREALDRGCRKIIVGLGGSATNDGGAGIVQALGARLTGANYEEIGMGGGCLSELAHVDLSGLDQRLKLCHIRAATDVNNPLCGVNGASAIYGPQKGATPEAVSLLDDSLRHFAEILRRDIGKDVMELPGMGAAGGAAAGLFAMLNVSIEPGADLVCDEIKLDTSLRDADLVIVGEGQLDSQTLNDKAPIVVARRAKRLGLPVLAVAGLLGSGHRAVLGNGIDDAEGASPSHLPLGEALSQANELVADATERLLRRWNSETSVSKNQ
ncbi:MAG: glycerate kinase [Chloroflexi bacterium]|jgi:glycerate kinase|nr:MAG: glycerate kinase [Chloroflexota bacterium]